MNILQAFKKNVIHNVILKIKETKIRTSLEAVLSDPGLNEAFMARSPIFSISHPSSLIAHHQSRCFRLCSGRCLRGSLPARLSSASPPTGSSCHPSARPWWSFHRRRSQTCQVRFQITGKGGFQVKCTRGSAGKVKSLYSDVMKA